MKTITKHSVTTIFEARVKLLEPLLKNRNQMRKECGLKELGHDDFIRLTYKCTPYEWLSKQLSNNERRFLYFGF